MAKTAMICGVSGQDGAYLAKLLLDKGYKVFGTSRDAQVTSFKKLCLLGIDKDIEKVSMSITDFRSVLQTILRVRPDEIYNLAGQTSVGISFEQPIETIESISIGTVNILEAIRFSNLNIKFYNAGSSECFGDTGKIAADELTPLRPRSPYGVAKAAAFWQVSNYREAYSIQASTGILFNHESPLRPERFVTQKIVYGACDIANKKTKALVLGNVNISRDWGWAPDYVEAIWMMLQHERSDDFIIATGYTTRLVDFIDIVFKSLGMNWEDYVTISDGHLRPTDINEGYANPTKAEKELGWKAKYRMEDVALMMVEARMNRMD